MTAHLIAQIKDKDIIIENLHNAIRRLQTIVDDAPEDTDINLKLQIKNLKIEAELLLMKQEHLLDHKDTQLATLGDDVQDLLALLKPLAYDEVTIIDIKKARNKYECYHDVEPMR